MELNIAELRAQAERLIHDLPDGDPLDGVSIALIDLGVKAAVTSLDMAALDNAMKAAHQAGASIAQMQETIALISGLGVHSLMLTARRLLDLAEASGEMTRCPLTPDQQALWDQYVGTDPYWQPFEQENPGFMDALLRLSPDLFKGFHQYCAIPWQSGTVRAVIKELIAMASDATPTHRYLPGMRHHLHNAARLGAGKTAIRHALDIAAAAPLHTGVR